MTQWKRRIAIAFGVWSAVLVGTVFVFLLATGADLTPSDRIFGEPWMSVISFSFLAVFLATRRPENRLSWLLVVVAAIHQMRLIGQVAELRLAIGAEPTVWLLFWNNLGVVSAGYAAVTLAYLFVLFPNGRFPTPRFRLAAWIYAYVMFLVVGQAFYWTADAARIFADARASGVEVVLGPAGDTATLQGILHPRRLPELAPIPSFSIAGALALILAGLFSQIVRFRRGNALERQQVKWVVFVMAVWMVLIIPFFWFPRIGEPLSVVLVLLLPTGIAVPILRYRLWDIDIIIRRTLVFAVLSGLLVLVYFGAVTFMQWMVLSLIGQESPAVIVVATLLSAALFSPLRGRVQDFIDRRFYRRRYVAERVLARFADTVQHEVEMERVTAELLRLVDRTFRPKSVTLWLKEGA